LIEHRYCYVIENFLGFDAVQRKKTKQKMAGLAGFEPAPPPLVVGSIESNGKKVGKNCVTL